MLQANTLILQEEKEETHSDKCPVGQDQEANDMCVFDLNDVVGDDGERG